MAVGVKYGEIPTVYGSRVNDPAGAASVWVDKNFVQLRPETLQSYSNAQRYARPLYTTVEVVEGADL